ncbi:MAG: hypothetical protein A2046_16335 [Bacteroidetes bacterium GWA2_30_7]|nr:MAG: hypothetical protein A2046_16335 [Bacteroidetes bacterium GWA2_30_7]
MYFSNTGCKREGCTDSKATNYDSKAKKDDGSCIYDTVKPITYEDKYIGSEACKSCHTTIYDNFIKSGHPYKLNKVSGSQPVIPYRTQTTPTPAGYSFTDGTITYMIGGYGWKARFIDNKGYIVTQLAGSQYNLVAGTQSVYESAVAPGTKKYDCGECHTTGWKSVADGGSRQDGLEGMEGEFFTGGIHCEACHGKGNKHANTKLAGDITLNKDASLCGQCHTRNSDYSIAAKDGFSQHHEQYDEWLTSPHKTNSIGCNDCHDPHSSVLNDAVAPGEGVKKECTDCHSSTTYNANKHTGNTSIECVTCHMPYAGKSAKSYSKYKADVSSHIAKINTDTVITYFSTDGKLANVDGKGLPLTFVCYQCHKDENGEGGSYSQKTMLQLSTKATGFHQ